MHLKIFPSTISMRLPAVALLGALPRAIAGRVSHTAGA